MYLKQRQRRKVLGFAIPKPVNRIFGPNQLQTSPHKADTFETNGGVVVRSVFPCVCSGQSHSVTVTRST